MSIVVRDIATGDNLLELNSAMARAPASTMKVLPTWAALDLLGPAYAWKTRALADAPVTKGVLKGNLYLQGGGDPLLTIERWWRFVNDLRQTGLRVIEGDIVVDQTRFTAAERASRGFRRQVLAHLQRAARCTAGELAVVRFHDPAVRRRRTASTSRSSRSPEGLVVDNRVTLASGRCVGRNNQVSYSIEPSKPDRVIVSGRLSANCGPQSQRLAIMDPAHYAYGTFVTLWRQAGGQFRGGMLRAPTPPSARLLLTHESEPLSEIVRVTNKYSSNMMARSLVLAIAAEMNGTPATAAAGEQTIVGWLKTRGLEFPELVIANGSGLSRDARISADSMAKLLVGAHQSRYAPEFLTSLALGGLDGTLEKRFQNVDDPSRIRMKTGTLRDVSSIAGYVVGRSGKAYAVVVFVNHPGAQNGIGEPIQASLVDWVLKQ